MRHSSVGLISSMMLDIRKDIKSVKSAWSVLHVEGKLCDLTSLQGNN